MSEIDDMKRVGRAPAFPVNPLDLAGRPDIYGGLTKREYVAAAAMRGLLSNAGVDTYLAGNNERYHARHKLIAVAAVDFADALLAELAKP